jgi:large-conductance mechanosensitive channel
VLEVAEELGMIYVAIFYITTFILALTGRPYFLLLAPIFHFIVRKIITFMCKKEAKEDTELTEEEIALNEEIHKFLEEPK